MCETDEGNCRKDTFYDQLDATLNQSLKHDGEVVIGHFNPKVVKKSVYRGIIGGHDLRQ